MTGPVRIASNYCREQGFNSVNGWTVEQNKERSGETRRHNMETRTVLRQQMPGVPKKERLTNWHFAFNLSMSQCLNSDVRTRQPHSMMHQNNKSVVQGLIG